MEHHSQEKGIQDLLKEFPVQTRLHRKLHLAYRSLTTSTGRVAEALGITEAKLRNWENMGILAPARSSSNASMIDATHQLEPGAHPGQRNYGLRDIIRAVLIDELLASGYSLMETSACFKGEPDLVERVIEEIMPFWEVSQEEHGGIRNRISRAEKTLFWRAFVPRALYLSLLLLFEQASGGDVGIFLPVPGEMVSPQSERAEMVEDLPDLGEVLIGWHSGTHPFCIFPIHQVSQAIVSSVKDYHVIPFDWSEDKTIRSLNVHLVVHPELVSLLKAKDTPAHHAAGRLLGFLQKQASEWRSYLQLTGDYMSYNSPSATDPNVGDRLMNEIADAIVQLGGPKQEKQVPRWRFATIFLPRDSQQPLQQRDLVAWAHSAKSPHQIGLINRAIGHPSGISILAYQSGQIVYRPNIADGELDIGTRSIEEPVSSAIAIPIGGEYGHPVGVIYLASDEKEAFSSEEDLILLRIMEHILGELIMNYHARQLVGWRLPEMISHPEIVDRYFSEFETQNMFTRNLEALLRQVQEDRNAFEHLSFIAVNIDKAISIAGRYGQWTERSLIRAVGLRIREWVNSQDELLDAQLYHMYADRFFLFLKGISLSVTGKYAKQLHEALKGSRYLVEATRISRHAPDYKLSLEGITTHLGVTGYTSEKLREMLMRDANLANVRARLTLALEEALRLGRDEGGDNLVVWDLRSERFVCHRNIKRTTLPGFEIPESYEGRIREIVREELEKFQGSRPGNLS